MFGWPTVQMVSRRMHGAQGSGGECFSIHKFNRYVVSRVIIGYNDRRCRAGLL